VIVEPVGFVALLLGLTCFWFGPAFTIYTLLATSLLGAAAAAILTSVGGSSIPPSHVLLIFVLLEFSRHRWIREGMFAAIAPPRAGFFLILMLIYVVISGLFLPRLFAGMTYTFGNREGTGILMPLMPNSGNFTQMVYFIGDCICFMIVAAYARRRETAFITANAILFCCVVDLFFAVLDQVTYLTGTADLIMGPIRNASYAMLNDNVALGIKRLVGSFPEASAYAFVTLGLFGASFSLWLRHYRSRYSGILSFLLMFSLFISTSSTAYAGAIAYLAVAYAECLYKLQRGRATYNMSLFIFVAPFAALFLAILLQFFDSVLIALSEMADDVLFNKMSSASGIERGMWNQQAITNFFDTYGLGAGIGSVRASSFATSLLGNIGVFGAVAFVGFIFLMVFDKRDRDPEVARVREAAASGAIAYVLAGSVSGGSVDLGLVFCVLSGLACGRTAAQSVPQHSRVLAGKPPADADASWPVINSEVEHAHRA
jgi:hypothetical protein